jgi:SPP1 gp7 family putative phage head morphogenesis protein
LIFRPLLNANGLDEKIEFTWNLPSETEINNRIDRLTKLLESFNISENMRRMLQLELVKLLNIEGAEEFLIEPEIGADEEEVDMEKQVKQASLDGAKASAQAKKESPEAKKESKIKQPEVPGAKPNAKEMLQNVTEYNIEEQNALIASGDISIKEFVNLQEIKGFNYSDYLVKILRRLKIDKFEDLAAMSESDLEMGLLDENDIKKLRIILKDGFRRNKTIRQIEHEVRSNIDLKDRFDEEGKLQLGADQRPSIITRTETIRIANAGLLDNYKDNGIKKVRWLTALSERTCPDCEAKNGEVHELNESYGEIPLHPNCRCSWISVD